MARKPKTRSRTAAGARKKPPTKGDAVIDRLVHDGAELLARERPAEAAELFAKAVQRDWKHPQARLFLARAHGMLGGLQACEEEIERLVQIHPRDVPLLVEAGQTLVKFGCFERALEVFERAARSSHPSAEALTRVAATAERLHRLDDACAYAQSAIEKDPDAHEARLVLAKIQRRQGNLENAEHTLRQALDREAAPDPMRAKQWYELAAVLDGLGKYRDAAASLLQAKAALRAQKEMYREPAEEAEYTLRRLVQECTPERMRGWIEASADMPPTNLAALVGFPRSGTTLLEQILDAHPRIESVEESSHLSIELVTGMQRSVKATDSIAQVLDRIGREDVRRCRERYLAALAAHVEGEVGDRFLLDKNPIRTLVMPVLRRAVPDAKIIVALRDPRDVVLSNLMQAFEPSPMNLAFLDVKHGGEFYALNMEGWLKLREMMHDWIEVRYEDVVIDPAKQAQRVLGLLGLDWDDAMAEFHERAHRKAVRSPTYAAVGEAVHTRAVRRWENYADFLEPAMPTLDRVARELGYE